MRCEMCGAKTDDATTVKVESAELDVCDNCASHGTEVTTDEGDAGSTSTKYSTGSSADSTGTESGGSASSEGTTRSEPDMFDQMEGVVGDYGDRIREAREAVGLDRSELADKLNEKASRLRRLERGESLPDSELQEKIERELDITLGASEAADDWEGGDGGGNVTLGDVVNRD